MQTNTIQKEEEESRILKTGKKIKPRPKHNVLIELKETKTFKFINSTYTEEALEFINLLHPNNTGYYAFFTKQPDGKHQYMLENIDFNTLQNYLSLKDLYVSVNSFFLPTRRGRAVRQINAFWVDLDYYNVPKYKYKTAEQVIEILREDGMFNTLEPTFFCDSGHGMYIFWLIEDVPKQAVKLWQTIENRLVKQFKKYGADPAAKDVARVLRVAGSINSKTNRRASIIMGNNPVKRYTLKEIQNIILVELPYTKEEWIKLKKERRKKKNEYKKLIEEQDKKPRKLFTIKNLNYRRMQDIKQLIDLRAGNLDHCRHTALYMYTLFNIYCNGESDNDNILMDTINLNKRITEPLSDKDIEDIVSMAIDANKRYLEALKTYVKGTISLTKHLQNNNCIIYSNYGIITRLDITPKEMEYMETIIAKTEKRKRENKRVLDTYYKKLKADGKKTKKEELEETRQKIKALRKQGFKNKEIMHTLGITSTTTFERHIKYLKKNGLL